MARLIVAIVAALALWLMWASRPAGLRNDGAPEAGSESGMRWACQEFIRRSQIETVDAYWGDISTWTLVDGGDGVISVGARYSVAAATRYTTCVLRREGGVIRIVRLTRLQ